MFVLLARIVLGYRSECLYKLQYEHIPAFDWGVELHRLCHRLLPDERWFFKLLELPRWEILSLGLELFHLRSRNVLDCCIDSVHNLLVWLFPIKHWGSNVYHVRGRYLCKLGCECLFKLLCGELRSQLRDWWLFRLRCGDLL